MVRGRSAGDLSFDLVFYAVVLLLAYLAYFGIGDDAFYKDDYLWMYAARFEMNAGNLLTYQVVGFFRPLTNLSFYLSEHIRPGSSAFYHHTSLLLHVLNAVLWFHLLKRALGGRFVPAAAALIFAVSYNHSGAVLWISSRTTLMMTSFLLASFLLLLHTPQSKTTIALAVLAYALALASKETAVAGLGLVCLFQVWQRRAGGVGGRVVLAYAGVTLLYVLARFAVLGTDVRSEWGPGFHGLTNLLGAIVYCYYPWDVTGYFGPGAALKGASFPVWPELLALLIVAALVGIASGADRKRPMLLAVGWIVVGLAPTVLFRFRFLDVVSAVHNRYYYLAGLGVALSLAVLLSIMWERGAHRNAGRIVAVTFLAAIVASNAHAVRGLEYSWGDSCRRFGVLVDRVTGQLDEHPGQNTVVITGLETWQPFLSRAVQYYRPGRRIVYGREGVESARAETPCLHIEMHEENGAVSFRSVEFD